jgi:hypothetical protein
VNTGNVEIAALFAPKPLGMTAADDWTREMPTKGFPELKAHYTMMGVPNNVMLKPLLHFGHNYNAMSRMAMYGWFNHHLRLGATEPVIEQDYRRLSKAEMSVWDDQHPAPESGPEFERKLLRYLTDTAERQLQPACDSLANYREVVGGAMDILIGRSLREVGEVKLNLVRQTERAGCQEAAGLLQNTTWHEELPVWVFKPKQASRRTVLWLEPGGKAGLFNGTQPIREVQQMVDAGCTVVGADLLFQGEFNADGKPITETRRVKNPREAAGYTFGYNHSLFAQRVHDVLSLIRYASAQGQPVVLVGSRGAGPWVIAALAQAREVVEAAFVDTGGFRFGKVLDLRDPEFLPGGARYGDLPGMMALCAPVPLHVAGESEALPQLAKSIYTLASAPQAIAAAPAEPSAFRSFAVQRLTSR